MNSLFDDIEQTSAEEILFSQVKSNYDELDYDKHDFSPIQTQNFQDFFSSGPSQDELDLFHPLIIDDDIDNFISKFTLKINQLYFKGEFTTIQSIIEEQFPKFFENINHSLLYTIHKLRFFKLLKMGTQREILDFYSNSLIRLLKETKPNNWEKKNSFFNKVIRKKEIFYNNNYLYKYHEQFQMEVDKAIRNFLAERHNQDGGYDNIPINQPTIEAINNRAPTKRNSNHSTNQSKFESELEDMSTKEEFSDFEDELSNKLCNDDNNSNSDMDDLPKINKITIPYNEENSKVTISKIKLNENSIGDNTSNLSVISNKSNTSTLNLSPILPCKKQKGSEQTIFNQLPFLSSFKPKYAKRETIDKKIIRHFRQFFINQVKLKKFIIDNLKKDYSFYLLLLNGNLPPINFFDVSAKEQIIFKSFNSNYLLWFFSKKGVKELYSKFISTEGAAFVESVGNYYNLSDADKNQLSNYVNNLPFIFDISLVNKITEEEGYNCGHIYRKGSGKNKNKSKKRESKRGKKERSREKAPELQSEKDSSGEEQP